MDWVGGPPGYETESKISGVGVDDLYPKNEERHSLLLHTGGKKWDES
jgi:hypothetical protein